MTVVLSAQNIGKTFRQSDGRSLTAIQDISLELHAGEITCLLGASGSGKTTLLRILAGSAMQDKGNVRSDVLCPGPQLGYLSQSDRLLPWRSVVANVALGLELTGIDKQAARQESLAVLRHVGMEGFADSYPAQLSGGMQQRVILARMLALKPRLLLLDEPMSSLDVLARRELATLVKRYVVDRQVAALVITHSVEEACFLADRVLLVTRSPARLFKEIRLSDTGDKGMLRAKALDAVMHDLLAALETAA
jgi:NitT/TauT family transport system ATP-binding protein